MTESLPPVDLPKPLFLSDLVPLPYQQDIYLDPQSQARWKKVNDDLIRDHDGEADWEQMAGYVGKTYPDVFMESFRHALDYNAK